MSAGALALTVGGMSLTAGPASAAAPDCNRYGPGGLVSSITGGLCELVSGVKQTAEEVLIGETGERIGKLRESVKDGIAQIKEDVDHKLNKTERDTQDTQDIRPPEPRPRTSPPRIVQTPIGVICLPQTPPAACDGPKDGAAPTPRPTDTAGRERAKHIKSDKNGEPEGRDGRERRTAHEKRRTARKRAAWALPVTTPSPADSRRATRATTERQPAPVDVDRPRVDLLWPYTDRLHEPMRLEPGPVKPSPASDAMGTALTAALLISAILAARIGYARREHDAHIPFEPLRGRNNGRHRLA